MEISLDQVFNIFKEGINMAHVPVTPSVLFEEIYEETFRQHILRIFNKQIQQNYYVTGYAQMPDGKVVIRLVCAALPKDRP